MKRVVLAGLGCFAAFAFAVAATLDPVTIKRTPTKGQKINYSMTGKISVQGTDVEISSKQVDTITDVAADGTYSTESLQSDLTFNGMPGPTPSGPTKSVNKPSGELVSLAAPPEGGDQGRLASLTQFYYNPTAPVNVGDTWSFTGKKDEKIGSHAFKADMKYLGDEMIGATNTWKVQEDAKESEDTPPATLHSTVWLDKTDGSMVKASSTFSDLPVTGGITISGTMTFTRS